MEAFRKVVSDDRVVQRIQDNAALVFKQILAKQLLDGVLVNASILTTNTTIAHTLGRQPTGWIVVDKTAAGDIIRVSWDERNIVLKNATGTVPVTLWVF